MRVTLRRVGIGVGVVLGLLVLAAGGMYAVGTSRVERTYTVQTATLTLPTDSAGLARGAHLVRTMGCVDCHGEDLGGRVFEDVPPFRAVAANLTSGRGGLAATYSVEDFDRSIRHGIKPDGKGVLIMPSGAFHGMSDEDAAALIAYIRSAPPVDNELPPTEIRLPGRLISGMSSLVTEVRTAPARGGTTPPVGATLEYGSYLANATCTHCHGADLRGLSKPTGAPGAPIPPSLVAAVARWTPAQFEQVLTTGRTPEGKELNPQFMPWTLTAAMQPVEREALRMYIASLP